MRAAAATSPARPERRRRASAASRPSPSSSRRDRGSRIRRSRRSRRRGNGSRTRCIAPACATATALRSRRRRRRETRRAGAAGRPRTHLVAARVREHRLAASDMDPVDRLAQRRPGMRDMPRLAGHEIALEDVSYVPRVSRLDEEAREMRPRDEALARHVLQGTFVRSRNSSRRQRVPDAPRPRSRAPRGSRRGPRRASCSAGRCAARRRGSSGPPSSPRARSRRRIRFPPPRPRPLPRKVRKLRRGRSAPARRPRARAARAATSAGARRPSERVEWLWRS